MALAAASDLRGAVPSNPSLAACSAALCSSWLAPGRELQIGGYSLQSPGVINPVRSPNLTGRFADHPLSPL